MKKRKTDLPDNARSTLCQDNDPMKHDAKEFSNITNHLKPRKHMRNMAVRGEYRTICNTQFSVRRENISCTISSFDAPSASCVPPFLLRINAKNSKIVERCKHENLSLL